MYFWNNTDSKQYILTWDKTVSNYKILGTQNNQTGEANNDAPINNYVFYFKNGNVSNDYNVSEFNSPERNITINNALSVNTWSNAWSQSLQANIPIKFNINNDSNISFSQEEVVTPSADLTLINYGYEILNPSMTNINDYTIQNSGSNGVIGNVYQYTASTMTLTDSNRSNANVTVKSDINVTGTHRQWGVSVGPLLESNATAVINQEYNTTNFWNVRQNENVYYIWETGNNDWNKYTGLKQNGQLQSFSPPLTFLYEHNTSNDENNATDVNGTYSLNYDGSSLQVPWQNINGQWFPKINIKSGTRLTLDGTNYRIKILEEGLLVDKATNQNAAPGLNILDSSDLFWTSPNPIYDNQKILSVGEKPVNALVKVIKGECVETSCGN